jgi:DNA-binding winged helix-turn-helix (wHTH) protein
VLRFADFELDVAQQELRRGGDIVHMEPQVFNLLLHLVRNRGRIVSKDELIETVWNGRIVSEAALSSRINAARKAIGDTGNASCSSARCTSAASASSARSATVHPR